ncbi:hypothetical protein Ddye_023241 [Dipteronia dyeriana]|uniref:Reverse transcriptase n=1 Tax=Dipteronia dyeriana TaxID=168575 RepID=A0AAD9WT26_9ROSI|nr:hypothetical protein Ddye_023241 [Dipteronia dyeriana]
MENLREALDDCSLNALGFRGSLFTWCNKHNDSDLVQERLDRGICNVEWIQLFPQATVNRLEYWHSDHRPLMIDLGGGINPSLNWSIGRRKRFHFEACWVDKIECHNLVEKHWVSNSP